MIARGVLYEHRSRPQWGPGLALFIAEGKAEIAWADGECRTIRDPERYLVEVEGEAPEPAAKPEPRPRAKARPRPEPRRRESEWPDQRLRELFAEGLDDAAIAAELGRSHHAIRNRRWHLGLQRGARRDISEQECRRIVELRRAGRTVTQIARTVGRSKCGVEGVLVRAGVAPWAGTQVEWSEDEDRRLLELVEAGMSDSEISAELGRTRGAVWARRVNTLRVTHADRRRWTDEELEALARAVQAGESNQTIADKLGRTAASVRNKRRSL